MEKKHVTKPLVGAIALLALASALSDNGIKIASAETLDYIYDKIKNVSAAIGQVVGVKTHVAAAHGVPAAVDVSLPSTAAGFTEYLVTVNLPDLGAFHTGLDNFLQGTFSASGNSDFGASQASSGGGRNNSGRGTFLAGSNSAGGSSGLQSSAGKPIGAPLPRELPDFPGPQILADRTAVSPHNTEVSKKILPKDCTGADATGPDANAKVVLIAVDCSGVKTAGAAERIEAGAPTENQGAYQGAAGQSSTSFRTTANTGTTDPTSGPSLTTVGDNARITSNTINVGLSSGDSPADNGVDRLDITISALELTALPSPQSSALLALGLGCMIWVSYRRKSA